MSDPVTISLTERKPDFTCVRIGRSLGDGTYEATVVSYRPPSGGDGEVFWRDHGPTLALCGNGVPPQFGSIYAGTRTGAIVVVINPEPAGARSA